MQIKLKTLTVLFTGSLLLLVSKTSLAQTYGTPAFQPLMYSGPSRALTMRNTNWPAHAGHGINFNITFKDGTRKWSNSYIYLDSLTHKRFLIYTDKSFPKSDSAHRFQKVYPDQTIRIAADAGTSGDVALGLPNDTCWTFKTISGALTVYAWDSDCFNKKYELDPDVVTGIQLNDGPVEKFSDENLAKMMSTDPKALEYLKDKKYYQAISQFNKDALKAKGNK